MKILLQLVSLIVLATFAFSQRYNAKDSKNFLYYTKNAYCDKKQIEDWSCDSCSYTKGTEQAKVFTEFFNGTQGYTAYNPKQRLIILAFRGSGNIQNWIDNLDFIKEDYPYCEDCKIHQGFNRSWNSLATDCLDSIKELKSKYSRAKILVTGHSLGGAMAELAALNIIQIGLKVDYLYTYGTPRLGNTEFAEYAHKKIPQAMRVVHYKDPVPHIPLQAQGFQQVPTEVWYNSKDDLSEYKVCKMPGVEEDPRCSDSKLDVNIGDHMYYLGLSIGCNQDEEKTSQQEYKTVYTQMKEMEQNIKLRQMIQNDAKIMSQIE